MNANTVYDIFLALSETERQRHIELVNEYNRKIDSKNSILHKTKKKQLVYTKQNTMDYLMRNVFTSKKNKKSLKGYFEFFSNYNPKIESENYLRDIISSKTSFSNTIYFVQKSKNNSLKPSLKVKIKTPK
jgi:hypothetical protein